MLHKWVTSGTSNNKYRMDLRWFVWHLEFSSMSGNHCTHVQHPTLKIKVDSLSISCNLQEFVIRKPCLRRPVFTRHFLLLFWCRFTFCRFGCAFFIHHVQQFKTVCIVINSINKMTHCNYLLPQDREHESFSSVLEVQRINTV